jgi:hypothetical protein
MNLEQDIIERAGRQMANEIDFTILTDMLVSIGWRKIILRPMAWETGAELDQWVDQHVKGHYETMGLVWVFEQADDANWFSLRWL